MLCMIYTIARTLNQTMYYSYIHMAHGKIALGAERYNTL